jgi:hypothetical protein
MLSLHLGGKMKGKGSHFNALKIYHLMEDIHKLENYTIETIGSFIKNEVEESIHIEFKSGEALSKVELIKKEIPKDVSAFANSDGGIIIYGITEKGHKAHSISHVNGNEFTKEWLEQVISSSIQRKIPDLKIFPIREAGDISKTVYVVQIPSSNEAPHINKDKKFYKRFNFESVAMEEYEIRQLYGRKIKAELVIDSYSINLLSQENGFTEFECRCSIHNVGETVESEYKINIYLKKFPEATVNWETNQQTRNYNCTILDNDRFKVSASSIIPIYKDEALEVIKFKFKIPNESLQDLLEQGYIEFMVLYQNGKNSFEISIKDALNRT